MSVTTLWLWILLGTAVWWVWSCGRLFEHLRVHHPRIHEWMGRDTLFVENRRIDPVNLFRFLFGEYDDAIDDGRVSGLRARLRMVALLFCIGLVGFVVVFMAGLPPA